MSAAVISARMPQQACDRLMNEGFSLLRIPFCYDVDPRIGDHPDLQIFIYGRRIFCRAGFDSDFTASLAEYGELAICRKKLDAVYPGDCAFNIAHTGRYAICRKDGIPDEILSALSNTPIISVKQGYARCSTVIISEDTIATEDEGIAKEAEHRGIDVIRLTPGLIPLAGFSRGFAGGATGLYANTLYVTGTLPDEASYRTMRGRAERMGVAITELCDTPAEDYGSILFL